MPYHISDIYKDAAGQHWRIVRLDGDDIVVMGCDRTYGRPRGKEITIPRDSFASDYRYTATATL